MTPTRKLVSLVSSDPAVIQQRLESATLVCDDSLYLSEVAAVALISDREAIRQYVMDHTDGQRPGDFLAKTVYPSWVKDLFDAIGLTEALIDALDRFRELLGELTQSQANTIATQIAIEFDWSATPSADDIGRWTLDGVCENYYFANYAHIRRVVEG